MLKKIITSPKIFIPVLVSLLVLATSFFVFTETAQAAKSAKWINRGTIRYDGKYYKDSDPTDKNLEYTAKLPKYDGCTAKIKFHDWQNLGSSSALNTFFYGDDVSYAKKAEYVYPTGKKDNLDGKYDCSSTKPLDDDLNVGSVDNRRIVFIDDGKSIFHYKSGIKFKQASGNNDIYVREGSGACRDIIVRMAATSDDYNNGSLWEDSSAPFTGGNRISGSSTLYSVIKPEDASRTAESYADVTGKKDNICGVDNQKVRDPKVYSAAMCCDGQESDVEDLIANGVNVKNNTYFKNGDKEDDAFVAFVGTINANMAKNADGTPEKPGDDEGSGDSRPTCALGDAFGWILCPLVLAADGILSLVENIIQPFLEITPLKAGSESPVYSLWNAVRNIANVAFIIVFLIIVFSQATSIGITNYGIKRLLPRLIVIAVLTNISFFVAAFFIDIANVLSVGIQDLAIAALNSNAGTNDGSITFGHTGGEENTGLDAVLPALTFYGVGGGILAGLLVAKGIEVIIAPILIGVLIVIVAIIVLILRMVLIIILVIGSPIIAVGMLLQNTAKLSGKAISGFIKLTLMGVMINGLFVAGQSVATIIIATAPTDAGGFTTIVLFGAALVAKMAAVGMIPFMLTAAGGLAAWGVGAAKRIGGGYENLRGRQLRKQAREQQKQRAYLGAVTNAEGRFGKIRRGMFRASSRATMGRAARGELLETTFGAQQKLEDQRMNTAKTAVSRQAGLAYAPLMSLMRPDEKVDSFVARMEGQGLLKPEDSAKNMTKLADLKARFGSQLGTADFATGALLAAHEMGSNADQVKAATKAVPELMHAQGRSALETQNAMGGLIGQSAKKNGFGSLAYDTVDDDFNYKRFGNKSGSAQAAAASVPLELEPGQIYNDKAKQFTDFGAGLVAHTTDTATQKKAIRSIADAIKKSNKKGTIEELYRVADSAGAAARAEVDRMVSEISVVGGGGGQQPPQGPPQPRDYGNNRG